jgi:hypothetical protein
MLEDNKNIEETIENNIMDNDDRSNDISDTYIENDEEVACVLVIILQCETKPSDKNIANLKWIFSDPYFVVQICSVDSPENIPSSKTLSPLQYLENYYMRKALNYASDGPYVIANNGQIQNNKWWSDIPCIIIKDSSICNIIPSGMKKRIQVALDKAKQADLYFLCKWSDNCSKHTDVSGCSEIEHGSSLKWSIKPTSSQAVMYTPESRDFIRHKLLTATIPLGDLLNAHIARGELLATAFMPNIIDFDVTLSTSDADYAKLSECGTETKTSNSTSNSQWIWLFTIVAIILAIAVIFTIFTVRTSPQIF